MSITFESTGSFQNTERFLKRISSGQIFKALDKYGQEGTSALASVTPVDTGGTAAAWLLFGEANPGGRLAETWPMAYADVPFGDSFGKTQNEVYKESNLSKQHS